MCSLYIHKYIVYIYIYSRVHQHTRTRRNARTWASASSSSAATHCDTLQHAATHRDTLQHTSAERAHRCVYMSHDIYTCICTHVYRFHGMIRCCSSWHVHERWVMMNTCICIHVYMSIYTAHLCIHYIFMHASLYVYTTDPMCMCTNAHDIQVTAVTADKYGVATISSLLKITGLFCKRAL